MLPPVAPSVFAGNPKFQALYTNLAGSRLNSDASTRLIKQQRAQAEIEKQLNAARIEAAQRDLLRDALRSVASKSSLLPPELIGTCHLISAHLSGQLSAADLEILADDIEYFTQNVPKVAQAISEHLVHSAALVLDMAIADARTTGKRPEISELSSHVASLQDGIASQTTSISLTRARVTELGEQIHAAYKDLFEISIRIIEQTIHGSIARGTKARVEHLAVVAKGMELKLQILAQTDPILTDLALQSELGEYNTRLESMEQDLSSKSAALEKDLSAYDRAGKGMGEIAKRYASLLKEVDSVKEEIAKLESR